ncbi:glycosyltransferase family 4 protein [Cellulomonas sp. URHD0024]|uniref:glycosyltransferase family 4 protein n=1 Tax=Cellulomonas sp. URHD0024 TaxID=1302620 RepID=UPI0003FE25DE|nr:glycosyltransferase family 4 protein [Cellulomonas sp. URHD0024]
MRILAIHPSDELYGADRVLLEAAGILTGSGVVHVLLPLDVDYPEHLLTQALEQRGIAVSHADLPILRRDYLRLRALPGLARRSWRTWAGLRRSRPDVVYLSTSAALLVAPLARLVGARVVVHVHETWGRSERLLLGPMLRACTAVLAVSAAVAERLPGSVTVVHNGFEMPEVPPGDAAAVRSGLGVPPGALVALVASRWNAWKGHDVLLQAWAGLSRPDLHLVILGAPPPSGGSVDVPALVSELADPGRVHVVGPRDDVAAWVRASDVVLVPSTRPDPLPTIAIEAAGLGRAVVASADGGLRDIVEAGVTGALVAAGDVAGWTAALEALDAAVLTRQGGAARDRFERMFTLAAFAERFTAALTPVLGDGTAERSEGEVR